MNIDIKVKVATAIVTTNIVRVISIEQPLMVVLCDTSTMFINPIISLGGNSLKAIPAPQALQFCNAKVGALREPHFAF